MLEFIIGYVVIGIIVTLATGSIGIGTKWLFIASGSIYALITGRNPFGED